MARYPEAFFDPDGATPGGTITPRVVIVHSEATKGTAHPHGGLEWHFHVSFTGKVKQLVDTTKRADANYHANSFAISIETEDDGDPDTQPWTEPQLASLTRLIRWCCDTHRIPKALCKSWNGTGIGWHTMWGAPSPWTPVVKTCPGHVRIGQFPRLMDLVTNGAGTAAAPTSGGFHLDADVKQRFDDLDTNLKKLLAGHFDDGSFFDRQREATVAAIENFLNVDKLAAAIAAKVPGAEVDTVKAAVKEALREGTG